MAGSRTYTDAPQEIEDLGRKLIERFGLREAELARIKYVLKYTTSAVFNSELGYINKATGHWSFLTDFDFVITLWGNWWVAAPAEAQEANLLHQLCHIGVNPNSGAWELKKHPIECFPEEIAHYGAWNHPLQDLVAIAHLAKKTG
jgi:hypothetical protein